MLGRPTNNNALISIGVAVSETVFITSVYGGISVTYNIRFKKWKSMWVRGCGMYVRTDRDCIVCGIRGGTIHISDGYVCSSCMPIELMPDADNITLQRLLLFEKIHPCCVRCSEGNTSEDAVCSDFERSMLFTARTPGTLADELNRRFLTADSADLIVSFIKMSGVSLLFDSIRTFVRRNKLRIITTVYMGITESEALYELASLPNTEIRMELKSKSSPLHAKSMIFGSRDGNGTAYVGSANLTKSALTSGEEWVVKLREQDVPELVSDLKNAFNAMWNSGTLNKVTEANRADVERALQSYGR